MAVVARSINNYSEWPMPHAASDLGIESDAVVHHFWQNITWLAYFKITI